MITDSDGNWYPINSEDHIRLAEIAERLKGLGLLKKYPGELKLVNKNPHPSTLPHSTTRSGDGGGLVSNHHG